MIFAEVIERAAGLFYEWTSKKAADGEVTLDDLDQMDGELDEIKSAIEQQRALILAALEDAGGRDNQGDLNKAQKVTHKGYLEDLDVSSVKPGQDQRRIKI
jgi:hypothetical protein